MMNTSHASRSELVSVVIPTRKRLPFLKQTIASIRAQTYGNFELFVVADGHQEEVEEHILSLGDPRVRYLASEFAGRPSLARNLGIAQAKGKFLALCDDDDLWLPDKLALQVSFMEQRGLDFTFTAAGVIDADGNKFDQPSIGYSERISLTRFLTSLGNNIYPSTIMVNRAVLARAGRFDESPDLRGVEDYELFARLLDKTQGYGISDELVLYRGHAGSIQEQSVLPWLRKQLKLQKALGQSKAFPRWALLLRLVRVYYWAVRVASTALFSQVRSKVGANSPA